MVHHGTRAPSTSTFAPCWRASAIMSAVGFPSQHIGNVGNVASSRVGHPNSSAAKVSTSGCNGIAQFGAPAHSICRYDVGVMLHLADNVIPGIFSVPQLLATRLMPSVVLRARTPVLLGQALINRDACLHILHAFGRLLRQRMDTSMYCSIAVTV